MPGVWQDVLPWLQAAEPYLRPLRERGLDRISKIFGLGFLILSEV